MTMMLSPRRNGSGKKAAGRRKTSELVPSAWPVDDPSKFHSLSSSTDLIGPSRVYIRKGNKGDLCQFAVSLFLLGMGIGWGSRSRRATGLGRAHACSPDVARLSPCPSRRQVGLEPDDMPREDEVRR